jgi:[ribosomal protein S5]-alanine N-acetyltransferase
VDYQEELSRIGKLYTNRLCLRYFHENDSEDVYEYSSDGEVTKYLTWLPHKSLEQSRNCIIEHLSNALGVYAIELVSERKVIGCIDLRIIPEHNKGSFGYVLNRKYWNKGYMTEALSKIIEISFDKLNFNRIESTHYVSNEGSGRVMQKCGMQYEGTFKQELITLGKYVDVVHYSILKSDYHT